MTDATMPPLPELPEKGYLGDDVSYGYDGCDMSDYARAYAAQCLAAVAEDAARYRWLRAGADGHWALGEWDEYGYFFRDARSADVIDAAIDNARGKKQ